MSLMCICRLEKPKLLHLNTPRPEMNSDPNTPLLMQLHYQLLTQADANESNSQNMFQYANITQIYDQINTNIIITQIQYINEHKL